MAEVSQENQPEEAVKLGGITLFQLHRVLDFLGQQAGAWYEAKMCWLLVLLGFRVKFNLYHATYWIITPATKGYNERGCSYVELVSKSAAEQKPTWFVSHAWVEPICRFVTNLDRHAAVRNLDLHTAFWAAWPRPSNDTYYEYWILSSLTHW
eukprot:s5558_g2.t1